MMMLMQLKNTITVCACVFRKIIDREEIIRLVSALTNAGQTVTVIPDLCKVAISDAGQMAIVASTAIVACYPRAVKSIFDSLELNPARVFDMRNHSSEQVLSEMGISKPVFSPEQPFPELLLDEEQETWYPVIDRERCTNCNKCHDFCLFGVYSVKHGDVKVTQPQNCKNNCPACARVCPSKAIIFPKYEKSPINGGLHDEEQLGDIDFKSLNHIALKNRLEERRAKVPLLRQVEPILNN